MTEELWEMLKTPRGVAYFAKGSGMRPTGGWLRSVSAAARTIKNLSGYDMYLHLNPSRHLTQIKGSTDHIWEWRRFLLDVDPLESTRGTAPWNVLSATLTFLPSASACATIIDSGRGCQAWVEVKALSLNGPAIRRRVNRSVAGLLRHLAKTVDTKDARIDTGVGDLARVGRWPGTINTKTGCRTSLISMASASLDPEWVFQFEPPEAEEECSALTNSSQFKTVWPHLTLTAETFILDGVSSPGRNSAAAATSKRLWELGVPIETALRWVFRGARLCQPKLELEEARRKVEWAYAVH